MAPADPDPQEPIDAEVVRRAPAESKEADGPRRSFFEPMSGMVILGIDWLAFGVELPTEFLITPVTSVLAFGVTFWLVARIQARAGDAPGRARIKALLGGLAAGVPFPVTGTVVGAAIIALSGLPAARKRGWF